MIGLVFGLFHLVVFITILIQVGISFLNPIGALARYHRNPKETIGRYLPTSKISFEFLKI